MFIYIHSNLRQVGGFFSGTPVSSINKTDRHGIAKILYTRISYIMKAKQLDFINDH
jgi:hypothetical protein